jgi:multiple sugar transport system substrate-binding protein
MKNRPTPLSKTVRFVKTSVAAAAVIALAACSGGGAGEEQSAEADSLTVWHYFSTDVQVKVMEDFASKFEASHEGVNVKNVYQPYDQINSKFISAVGAGQGPDVVVFNGAEYSTLALSGALAPLDEYWAEFKAADQFPDGVQHRIDDKLYAVQGYVNLLGLWYNADLLKEVGVKPPQTLEELEKAMAAAKEAGYGGITLSALPQSQGEWQAYPWLTSQGFEYSNPDEAALAEGFDMVRSWVEKGYLSQEAVNWDQTVPFQKFTAGGIAFAMNGNWQVAAAEKAKFDYGVVPLPVGPDGKVYLGGEGQGISASSDTPDLAWEYLTETYLNAEAELSAFKTAGYIPARADASQDKAVTSSELLEPFSQTLNQRGANYPAASIPPESVAKVQSTVGQAWSAVVGGQLSPEAAASQVMNQLETLLK